MKRFVTTFLLVSSFTLPAATDLSQIEVYEREAITKELTYHLNTSSSCDMVLSWDDRGSGADTDGYFFTPATKNQYLIGGAVRNKIKIEKLNDILISEARDIVRAYSDICITTLSEPGGNPKAAPVLLTAPLDWKRIWTDKGSGAKNDGSIWVAIPSDDNYKCLGSIAQPGYKTKPDLPNYRCVHISLTEKIIADKTLWSDKGSGANSQVTIFELPNANTFVAVPSRTESAEVYDLKTNASSEPDEKIIEEKLAIRMIQVKKDLGVTAEPEEKKEEKKLVEEKKQLAADEIEKLIEEGVQKRLEAEEERLAKIEEEKLIEEGVQKRLAKLKEEERLAEEAEVQKRLEEERLATDKSKTKYGQKLPTCTGSDSSDWNNCYGETIFADGEKYVGEFKGGLRHGQGTFTYRLTSDENHHLYSDSDNKYVGEWKDDMRHGQGTFTSAYGEKYVGEFKGGLRHGQGTFTYANGDKYVGEWDRSDKNGQGTFTYANGDKYVGEWKNNELINQLTESNKNKSTKKETNTNLQDKNLHQDVQSVKKNNQSEQNNFIENVSSKIISELHLEQTWIFYTVIFIVFLIVLFTKRKEKDELDNNHSANSDLEEPPLDEGEEINVKTSNSSEKTTEQVNYYNESANENIYNEENIMAMYKYKVTDFKAKILDNEKNWSEKIRAQLEEQLELHANEGWTFVGQYNFPVKIGETGCFGNATGKTKASVDIYQLVFRKEI